MARRETVTSSVHVERPPSEVFDYLADVARHGEWSPKPYRVEGVAAGHQVTAGKRFTSYGWLPGDKDHRNDVEVTAVEAPSRLVMSSTDKGQLTVNTFTVAGDGNGSRVERVMEVQRPAGVVGVVFPLIATLLIRPDVAKGLARLKSNLEGRD